MHLLFAYIVRNGEKAKIALKMGFTVDFWHKIWYNITVECIRANGAQKIRTSEGIDMRKGVFSVYRYCISKHRVTAPKAAGVPLPKCAPTKITAITADRLSIGEVMAVCF